MRKTIWTQDQEDIVRRAWIAGEISSKIARRVGFTKGAVIAKARRMGLDPRPSPIRPAVQPPRVKTQRAGAHTLPRLASLDFSA